MVVISKDGFSFGQYACEKQIFMHFYKETLKFNVILDTLPFTEEKKSSI